MTNATPLATATSSSSRVKTIAVWTIQIALGAAFLAAGGAKLAGAEQMVQIFDQIGAGQGFRVVTGLVEVAGGIAILIPAVAVLGAALLAATMVGAVLIHILVLPTTMVPALVLLALSLAVVWMRRLQLSALVDRAIG